MTVRTSSAVIFLEEEAAGDPGLTGMKAATLARLAAEGFPVPPGFVVTVAACNRIALAGPGAGIPAELWADIRAGVARLGDTALAVRSSGTAEDLADASFAGQYETVLGVRGPGEVAAALRTCVASAAAARVRAYAGEGADPARMAVLVQRLVPADAAGVAFTANPVTGDPEILVSAVKGLGERLVSGAVTPDEWVVREGEVTCLNSVEDALDAGQVGRVAELARRVAELARSPQDVEWALAGEDLWLLQARPITALPVPPRLELPVDGYWEKDDAHYPTPMTPFGASVYLPAMTGVIGPLAEEIGLLIDGGDHRSIGGEVYTRMIPLGGKDGPPPPAWVMWLAARMAPPLRRRARAARAFIESGAGQEFLERWHREWREAFRSEADQLRTVDLTSVDDDALIGHLDRLQDLLTRGEDVHFHLHAPYVVALHELTRTCRELLGWEPQQALCLLSGTSQASSEPGRQLAALAFRLAEDPAAVEALSELDDGFLARLRQASPAAGEAFDAYLDRYGHRTISYDPGDPTLFERPAVFAGLLRDRVCDRMGAGGDGSVSTGDESGADALERARAVLAERSEADRRRFETVLEQALRAYGPREDNIFFLDNQPCALLRYTALEMGRRLADRGTLATPADAVYLTEAELRQALTGPPLGELRALVSRRKAERAWVLAHPGPATYGPAPGPPPDMSALPQALRVVNTALVEFQQLLSAPGPRPAPGPGHLAGVPASPGSYSGPARIVRGEAEFTRLRPGDVLVCPTTSPPWSILFLHAGAVVTDAGGVLSHTAVIAREYGIPAVLATGDATRRLHDGDLVNVDGTAGTVTIVQPTHTSRDPLVGTRHSR